jgi:hypothetical protein
MKSRRARVRVVNSPQLGDFSQAKAKTLGLVPWESRPRGSPPMGFAFDGAQLSIVERPARHCFRVGATRCMLLVMFGRVSPARAALTGRLGVWGDDHGGSASSTSHGDALAPTAWLCSNG